MAGFQFQWSLSPLTLGGKCFIQGWLRKSSPEQMQPSTHQVLASNIQGMVGTKALHLQGDKRLRERPLQAEWGWIS